MKKFLDRDFLLSNDTAKLLYHNYAEKLPIIDYHCHVSPREIAENKRFSNITELWLGGDHYKWRAIRSVGVPEKYITGDASDYDKFKKFAEAMPKLIGNPLYHWTHLELRRYFDCELILNPENADEIWRITSEKLADDSMRAKAIIENSRVDLLCTTDDPIDSLEYHEAIKADADFKTRVLPAFRPDKALNINRRGIKDYFAKLAEVSGKQITSFRELEAALDARLEFFVTHGCRTSDHSFDNCVEFETADSLYELDKILEKAVASDGAEVTHDEFVRFRGSLMCHLAEEYKRHSLVMQLHYGANRNVSTRDFETLGPDTGFDIIDGRSGVADLARMLDAFNMKDALPRTIIYSLNPCDNAAVGALLGGFQRSGDGKPLVMQGSAWWFSDNIKGMREQMETLATLSAFGEFLGMLTDSRSLVSYPRHEYFRRILCDYVGRLVENGEYPYDPEALAELIIDISYNNTKNFFSF